MKIPPECKATLIGLTAGFFLAGNLAAKEKDPAAAPPGTEIQPPHLLLANVWNPSIDPTGWWMSEKYDGLRAWWDGQKLWSRKGNLIHAPGYFLAELPRDIVLDGELWIGHGKFEETMSIVRSETPDERWKRVRFMVFDAPKANGNFEQRMQFLRATVSEGSRFVRVVAQERCQGAAQLLAERAITQVPDAQLSASSSSVTNSIATICWHISGNLKSRFTDFLTTDGEKEWRDREEEFALRTVSSLFREDTSR